MVEPEFRLVVVVLVVISSMLVGGGPWKACHFMLARCKVQYRQ